MSSATPYTPAIGFKDSDGIFRAVSETNPLPSGTPMKESTFARFSSADVMNSYTVNQATGDIITLEGNVFGRRYLKISKSPFNIGTTTVTTNTSIKPPFLVRAGITITPSNSGTAKVLGISSEFAMVGTDALDVVEATTHTNQTMAITSAVLSGSGVLLTITTPTPHGRYVGGRVALSNFNLSTLNVGPVLVASVISRTVFTITMSIGAGFDATYTGGVVNCIERTVSKNEIGMLFETSSPTQFIPISRQSDASEYVGSTTTVTTHAPSYAPGRYSQGVACPAEYALDLSSDGAFYSWNSVNNTASQVIAVKSQTVIPETNIGYKGQLRVTNLPNLSRPLLVKITLASKSGTTTATITTDVAHNLTANSRIIIKGINDLGNFPNMTASQAPVIVNATQFQVSMGTAVTAASTGGVIYVMNGSNTMPNQSSSIGVQSVSASSGELMVNYSASPAGLFNIGDTVNFYGTSPSASLTSYEKPYLVADILTTSPFTVTLVPAETTQSAIPNLASTPTGGLLIRRTDVCLHWVIDNSTARQSVEVIGSNRAGDAANSLKVIVGNTVSVNGTVSSNSTNTPSTTTGGYPTSGVIISAAGTNAQIIKNSAPNLNFIIAGNNTASAKFIKIYNKTTTPVVGTDTPIFTFLVPANSSVPLNLDDARLTLGIGMAITGGMAHTDTTAIAANDVVVSYSYL